MLLPGVLFVLFLTGCWVYFLTDAAVTPASEFRGLPKGVWIAVIAATFILGALAWVAARRVRPPRQRTAGYRLPEQHTGEGQTVKPNRPAPGLRALLDGWAAGGDWPTWGPPASGGTHPAWPTWGTEAAPSPGGRWSAGRGEANPAGSASRRFPLGPDDDPDFMMIISRRVAGMSDSSE